MELWDAYDADFQKIAGRTLIRGEAVPEGEYHLCCVILVKHRDGTYLLMQRDPRKPLGGLWEASAGGAAQQGDTPEMCARRELREETGIEPKELICLGTYYPAAAYSDEVIWMYLARGLTFGEQKLDDDEFLALEAMPLKDLVQEIARGNVPDGKTQAAVMRVWCMENGIL